MEKDREKDRERDDEKEFDRWKKEFSQIPEIILREYWEAFKLFDKDGNYLIIKEELATVMRGLGQTPTEEEICLMMTEVDKDGSGYVDFGEFVGLMTRQPSPVDPEEDLRKAFRMFDRDGNGQINAAELKHIMTNIGETLTEEQVDDMIQEADIDQDGMINYEEFIRVVATK
ncbi:hypothetical protein Vafri_696 [Volvox africanus]|nr:hypothetical protein Vafri_696 [Volvox africanus]